MIYIVVGVASVLFGISQLVFEKRNHAYYWRRNEGRSRWRQNPRGWSLRMTRYAGIVAFLGGLFLVAFGASQLAA
jgi:ABC-type Fe3+ transport system permease subunit